MRRLRSEVLIVFCISLIATSIIGCKPKIGDGCSSSTDCSTYGDRLCDTTLPGGYCTVFNCEPDTCPGEARCIAFDKSVDPRCKDHRWARFERTFCMRGCGSNSDCRDGYVCADMSVASNPWGAKVTDTGSSGSKVCLPPWSETAAPIGMTEVCGPYEGTWPQLPDASASNDASVMVDGDTSDSGKVDASADALDDVALTEDTAVGVDAETGVDGDAEQETDVNAIDAVDAPGEADS